MNEKEKMLAGKVYDCMYLELDKRRLKANALCIKYNSFPDGHPERKKIQSSSKMNFGNKKQHRVNDTVSILW